MERCWILLWTGAHDDHFRFLGSVVKKEGPLT
jgi:hypothetical protein